MRKGFYPDLSNEDYNADPALRASTLNRFATSPDGSDIPRQSLAMMFGQIFHHLALTPKLPLPVAITEASITMVSEAQEMAHVFRESAEGKELLGSAFCESSLFWTQDGIDAKARPDILAQGYMADLKTTRDLSRFEADALGYGYHRQAAWYLDGVGSVMSHRPASVLLVAMEKTAPYRLELFKISKTQLEAARQQNAVHLELYKRSLKDKAK